MNTSLSERSDQPAWKWLAIVTLFAAVHIGLQLAVQGSWGFHRDEFLYMAMARRVDWGYWSNPPLIGALAWVGTNLLGTSLFAVRLIPLAASVATICLTAAIVRGCSPARSCAANGRGRTGRTR